MDIILSPHMKMIKSIIFDINLDIILMILA
jgi:hypothetical protein